MLTFFKLIFRPLVWIPSPLLGGAAKIIGLFLYYIIPYRRKLIYNQMKMVLGTDLCESELRALVKRNYIHYASLLFEWLILFSINLKTTGYFKRHFFSPDEPLLKEAVEEEKGVILIGAHIGVWEAIGGYVTQRYRPISVTVKLVNIGLFQKMREEIQNSGNIRLLDSRMGRRRIVALMTALRNREIAGIFLDQYRQGEPFIPFLGYDARTNSTAAILYRKTGAAVILIHIIRERFGRYRLDLHRVMPPAQTEGQSDADHVIALSTHFNRCLGEVIRKHPEQWLWAHRRFKENPAFVYE